jgi:hypothetical protein
MQNPIIKGFKDLVSKAKLWILRLYGDISDGLENNFENAVVVFNFENSMVK